jgi:hypothetical protein
VIVSVLLSQAAELVNRTIAGRTIQLIVVQVAGWQAFKVPRDN